MIAKLFSNALINPLIINLENTQVKGVLKEKVRKSRQIQDQCCHYQPFFGMLKEHFLHGGSHKGVEIYDLKYLRKGLHETQTTVYCSRHCYFLQRRAPFSFV